LHQVLLRAFRDHTQVGVMLVDLDRFKLINDTLDHTVGDRLLREVATRLQRCVRECDTISRQGGDEFAVLLPDLASADYAARIAQRIVDDVAQPCRLNEGKLELHITCSIGISLYPRDGGNAEILLKNADIALYRAKDMGRNGYQFYLSGATILARERLNLETSLRYAVERKQLELYYQPKWNFRANAITGVEALIRWNHPEHGLLAPAKFIPIAEDSGLILPMGEWVLRTALGEIGQIHRDGFTGLRVAINLSGRQFLQSDLAELIRGMLVETDFDPACIELELTESILMHHNEENLAKLRAFKTMGVRIAIDDFGTGFSSLSYLQRFPVDILKIDRSFVMDLPASASSIAIVDAIVTLAHGLGLEVVAEGVETPEQATLLHAHACDEGQGYHFGRPMPLLEFQNLLARHRSRATGAAVPSGG
jgi:diguanylate cyclase (GGDEF)-like protein